jgi:hypothetical protein
MEKHMRKHIAIAACSMLVLASLATPASAADNDTVNFSGSLSDNCSVVASPGTLGAAADNLSLSTEESGGSAASLSVTSVGTLPEVDFAAPAYGLTTGSYTGTPTAAIKYAGTNAASQTSYTSSSSVSQLTGNSASYVINGRLSDSGGFLTGTYTMSVLATCGYGV